MTSGWVHDIRYAGRMMLRTPMFTLAAVILTVAFAIAANTSIFSFVNAELLRPLPFRDPNRLLQIAEKNDRLNLPSFGSSVLNFLSWRGNFVNPTIFINHGQNAITGRSLINDRAICPQAEEHLPASENIRTLRAVLNTLGDGFVEAVDDQTLIDIAAKQPSLSNGKIMGETLEVRILEAPGSTRIGRFGWKNQHGSILSFSADAYLNQVGITNRLKPVDTTTVCKTTTDPEDTKDQTGLFAINHFTQFIRGTMVPPRDTAVLGQPDVKAGEAVFAKAECSICHVSTMVTAPPGTVINGGTFTIPDALGNKIIHPFSDFLLHDVGTGDGIVQGGPQDTQHKLRTPALWGVRAKTRFTHALKSESFGSAILRHQGEASDSSTKFKQLTPEEHKQLLAFLNSL